MRPNVWASDSAIRTDFGTLRRRAVISSARRICGLGLNSTRFPAVEGFAVATRFPAAAGFRRVAGVFFLLPLVGTRASFQTWVLDQNMCRVPRLREPPPGPFFVPGRLRAVWGLVVAEEAVAVTWPRVSTLTRCGPVRPERIGIVFSP